MQQVQLQLKSHTGVELAIFMGNKMSVDNKSETEVSIPAGQLAVRLW